jgi:Cof subfamily protein (haloacid dehalogenase superfamily)
VIRLNIEAIITDLDGTLLLPDGSIGAYTRNVFQRLKKKNIDIHIATGRPLSGALKTVEALALAPEMAVFNGTQLFHRDENRMLQKLTLPQEVAIRAIDKLESAHLDYFVYHEDVKHLRLGKHAHISQKLRDFFIGIKEAQDREDLPTVDLPRIAFWAKEEELTELIKEFKNFPNIYLEYFHFDAIETFPKVDLTFVEIQQACEGKVELIRYLEREKNILPENIMVFGDQNNDMGLIKTAGYSLVVSNAFEACLKIADEVIGSNAEEAVAKKLEAFFLS